MTNFDLRVRAAIRKGVRAATPALRADIIQMIAYKVLRNLQEEFVIEEKLTVDKLVVWEYRAVAREPDTGEVYDFTEEYPTEEAARNAARQQELILPPDPENDLPQLVLGIERRQAAGTWDKQS